MELISQIVKNDLFIFISSLSGIVGLIVALVVKSQVTNIKKNIDKSKEKSQNLKQSTLIGSNKGKING